jgi:N-methylhydantoinase A
VENVFHDVEAEGREILQAEQVDKAAMVFQRTADMRYVGQEYFVNIPLGEKVTPAEYSALTGQFHAAYQTRYGHSNPEEAIEFVNLRVSAVGQLGRRSGTIPEITKYRQINSAQRRKVIFNQNTLKTQVFHRANLQPGDRFNGPAIIEEVSCTTVIPPGYGGSVDTFGNVVITRGPDA